jgi:sulfonate transport system substrate-binding protein
MMEMAQWQVDPQTGRCKLRETTMSHVWPAAVTLLAVALLTPAGAQGQPEVPKPRLAVGGKSAIFYLPLSITERLGYFRDAGLDVEIADVQSGARALQSLVGGSAGGRHLRSHHSDAG